MKTTAELQAALVAFFLSTTNTLEVMQEEGKTFPEMKDVLDKLAESMAQEILGKTN